MTEETHQRTSSWSVKIHLWVWRRRPGSHWGGLQKQYVGFIHSGRIRSKTSSININHIRAIDIRVYVTLENKTSVQSLGCICSNSQKYIVWVKIINVYFVPKISCEKLTLKTLVLCSRATNTAHKWAAAWVQCASSWWHWESSAILFPVQDDTHQQRGGWPTRDVSHWQTERVS